MFFWHELGVAIWICTPQQGCWRVSALMQFKIWTASKAFAATGSRTCIFLLICVQLLVPLQIALLCIINNKNNDVSRLTSKNKPLSTMKINNDDCDKRSFIQLKKAHNSSNIVNIPMWRSLHNLERSTPVSLNPTSQRSSSSGQWRHSW